MCIFVLFSYNLLKMKINQNLISAENCKSKEEIRMQIDIIDQEIIKLFAKRNEYVHAIVKFKNDIESIIAQDRKDEVITNRGIWAEKLGLEKSTFEDIYKLLINANIQTEIEILQNNK